MLYQMKKFRIKSNGAGFVDYIAGNRTWKDVGL